MSPETTSVKYRSPSPVRARNALLAQSGIARTFGGLGSFLAVIFLGGGIYLLQESFTDPLRAQAVGLIAGKAHRSHAQTPVHSLVMTPSPLVPPKETAKNLASTIASA